MAAVMIRTMATQLKSLREETWGEKLRRARNQAGLNVRDAAQLVSPYVAASHNTLNRLELLEERPTRRSAQLAYVALLVYGIDPAELGLTELSECRVFDAEEILRDVEARKASVRQTVPGLLPSTESALCWSGAIYQAALIEHAANAVGTLAA